MMELSQALARSTSMLAQQPHPFQAFIGLSKEGHFSFRGLVSGGHLSGQGLVVGDSVRPETYGRCKNLHIGISFRACWTSDEDPVSSRDAPCRSPNVTCQQQTLERPSQYCMGLEVAARHACNDARIVNARAREGFVLIARGFERLDRRARQDVALLGSGFLKLDARAREETVKLDIDARRNAARLQSMATDLRDEASAQLKTAAEKHWSDGALDADLRLADLRAKRRAMEDAYMALQLVKNIHNGMAERAYKRQNEFNNIHGLSQESSLGSRDTSPPPVDPGGKLMFDRLTALQDAYWDIASALSEADGIDYSDPEEPYIHRRYQIKSAHSPAARPLHNPEKKKRKEKKNNKKIWNTTIHPQADVHAHTLSSGLTSQVADLAETASLTFLYSARDVVGH